MKKMCLRGFIVSKISGSDAALKVIEAWGVNHLYGYPGGSFDSTMNAIHNQQDKIKFIQVRHEEAGAIAAAADAKLTGKIGVCFGSAGPGAIHLMNGLYDAKIDRVPVLALVGQVPTTAMNMDFFQAQDEGPAFNDVAVWDRVVMTADAIPRMVDEAIRQAYEKKGVAVLILPKDLGWAEIEDNYQPNVNAAQKPLYPDPDPAKVDEAVKMIKDAKAPMIYFGQGAKGAAKELKAASEKFKMPMVSSVLAKGVVEDDYPAYLGSTGRVAPKPGVEAGFSTDLVLWVGNDVPFSIFLFNKKAKIIQVDVESEKLGKRRHNDLGILADAKKTLAAITAKGEEKDATPFYNACLANKNNWDDWQDSFKDSDEMPVRPEPIFDVINKEASNKAVFGVDVGNININFARLIKLHDDQIWATSGKYATMGFGMGASISGAVNYPDRDVYNLTGDGAFAMLMEEVLTQVKFGLKVINIVFSNETLGFIEAEQDDDSHQPHSGIDLPDTDWAGAAKAMGANGYTARTKEEFQKAMDAAKASDKASVIDVKFTHKMPFTTEHMYMDPSWQDKDKVGEFVKKYDAQDLKPFSYFLKQAQK